MRYRIDGDQKVMELTPGVHLTTDATDCEMELWAEIVKLRAAVLNQRGDDLCWIEDHDSMRAAPLPREEMLESCRRYVDQLHEDRPALCAGQMTIAQLETRVVELEEALHGHVDKG